MALLADLSAAALLAAVVFLLTLGVLVIFVETVASRSLVAVVAACLVLAGALLVLGEPGVSLLPIAFAGAFLANHVFEWLTTR